MRLSEAAAIHLEKNMLAAVRQGIEDQHQVFRRWIGGTTDFPAMSREYVSWFSKYVSDCGNIAVEASAYAD